MKAAILNSNTSVPSGVVKKVNIYGLPFRITKCSDTEALIIYDEQWMH